MTNADADLHFMPCFEDGERQIFAAVPKPGGFEVQAKGTLLCIDSVRGTRLLLHPCYEQLNLNQVWLVEDEKLIWKAPATTQQPGEQWGQPICAAAVSTRPVPCRSAPAQRPWGRSS